MARDPVCHMDIDEDKPHEAAVHEGKTYRFCSGGCRDRFLENPEPFISETKKEGERCIACRTEIRKGLYIRDKGPYCCEKCYFRDRFLGGVIKEMEGTYLATIEAFVDTVGLGFAVRPGGGNRADRGRGGDEGVYGEDYILKEGPFGGSGGRYGSKRSRLQYEHRRKRCHRHVRS